MKRFYFLILCLILSTGLIAQNANNSSNLQISPTSIKALNSQLTPGISLNQNELLGDDSPQEACLHDFYTPGLDLVNYPYGRGFSGGHSVANDVIIDTATTFRVETVTFGVITIAGAPASFILEVYEDDGIGGIGNQTSMTYTFNQGSYSSTYVGLWDATYPAYEVVFTIPDNNLELSNTSLLNPKTYWINIKSGLSTTSDFVFWIANDHSNNGTLPTWQWLDDDGIWTLGDDLVECAMKVAGDCYNNNILVVCDVPENLVISNTGETTTDLSWNSGNGNISFEIVYGPATFDPDSGGQSISTSDSVYTLTNLAPSTNYEVYIRAICNDTTYSDWISGVFTTNDAPLVCNDPNNLVVYNVGDTVADVIWNSGEGNISYEIIYGPAPLDPNAGGQTISLTDTTYSIIGLSPETTYEVYVRAICNDTTFTDWIGDSFVTDESNEDNNPGDDDEPGVSVAENQLSFAVYPNPAKNNVTFLLDGLDKGQVSIYSIAGQEILINELTKSKINIDVSSLKSGLYIYKIKDGFGNVLNVNKLIIQK